MPAKILPPGDENARALWEYMRRTGQVFGHYITHYTDVIDRLERELGLTPTEQVAALRWLRVHRFVVRIDPHPSSMRALRDPDIWKNGLYVLNPHMPGSKSRKKTNKPVKKASKRVGTPRTPAVSAEPAATIPAKPTLATPSAVTPIPAPSEIDIYVDLPRYVHEAHAALMAHPSTGNATLRAIGEVNCAQVVKGTIVGLSSHKAKELVQLLRSLGLLVTCSSGCSHLNTNAELIDVMLQPG